MPPRKTHEQFVAEVYEAVGNEYEVLGTYQGNGIKVKMKHVKCGNIYETTPSNFLSNNRCRPCSLKEGASKQRKTHEQFVAEVYEAVGNEYTVLNKYFNSKSKIKMKHNTCGHEFEMMPSNFLHGQRCPAPDCVTERMRQKFAKTHEQFVAEIYEMFGDEYSVLSQYISNKINITVKHNPCGSVYEVTPNNFLYKQSGCRKCSNQKLHEKFAKTHEEFVADVYAAVGDEFTVLGFYINSKTKLDIRHNVCGYVHFTNANHFFRRTSCPKCSLIIRGQKRTKTHEQFVKEMYELYGEKYTVLDQYVNDTTKLRIRRNTCGCINKVTPTNILRYDACLKCAIKNGTKKAKKTHKKFIKEVYKLVGDEYTVLGKYVASNVKIKMKHNKCDFSYDVDPGKFLIGRRCPKCNASKGEVAIEKWLIQNNIKYVDEYIIDNCRHIKPLPFDFAVFKENGTPLLIEYQGIQHHEPVGFFGGEKGFKSLVKRDKIKANYCKKHNIPLLIIDYWDFDNIERILEKELLPLDLKPLTNESKQLILSL